MNENQEVESAQKNIPNCFTINATKSRKRTSICSSNTSECDMKLEYQNNLDIVTRQQRSVASATQSYQSQNNYNMEPQLQEICTHNRNTISSIPNQYEKKLDNQISIKPNINNSSQKIKNKINFYKNELNNLDQTPINPNEQSYYTYKYNEVYERDKNQVQNENHIFYKSKYIQDFNLEGLISKQDNQISNEKTTNHSANKENNEQENAIIVNTNLYNQYQQNKEERGNIMKIPFNKSSYLILDQVKKIEKTEKLIFDTKLISSTSSFNDYNQSQQSISQFETKQAVSKQNSTNNVLSGQNSAQQNFVRVKQKDETQETYFFQKTKEDNMVLTNLPSTCEDFQLLPKREQKLIKNQFLEFLQTEESSKNSMQNQKKPKKYAKAGQDKSTKQYLEQSYENFNNTEEFIDETTEDNSPLKKIPKAIMQKNKTPTAKIKEKTNINFQLLQKQLDHISKQCSDKMNNLNTSIQQNVKDFEQIKNSDQYQWYNELEKKKKRKQKKIEKNKIQTTIKKYLKEDDIEEDQEQQPPLPIKSTNNAKFKSLRKQQENQQKQAKIKSLTKHRSVKEFSIHNNETKQEQNGNLHQILSVQSNRLPTSKLPKQSNDYQQDGSTDTKSTNVNEENKIELNLNSQVRAELEASVRKIQQNATLIKYSQKEQPFQQTHLSILKIDKQLQKFSPNNDNQSRPLPQIPQRNQQTEQKKKHKQSSKKRLK